MCRRLLAYSLYHKEASEITNKHICCKLLFITYTVVYARTLPSSISITLLRYIIPCTTYLLTIIYYTPLPYYAPFLRPSSNPRKNREKTSNPLDNPAASRRIQNTPLSSARRRIPEKNAKKTCIPGFRTLEPARSSGRALLTFTSSAPSSLLLRRYDVAHFFNAASMCG